MGATFNALIVFLSLCLVLAAVACRHFYLVAARGREKHKHFLNLLNAAEIKAFDYDKKDDTLMLSLSCATLFNCGQKLENFSSVDSDNLSVDQKNLLKSLQSAVALDGDGREINIRQINHQTNIYTVKSLVFNDADGRIDHVAGILIDKTAEIKNRQAPSDDTETDELTKVFNSGAIRRLVRDKLSSYDGADVSAFIILAIDNFKNVNAVMGHQTGDRILTMTAATLKDILRSNDYVGRLGGDEFCVYFTKVPEAKLMNNICERINKQITNRVADDDITMPITVSIGCTVIRLNDDFKAVYGRADRALYLARENGRNTYAVVE